MTTTRGMAKLEEVEHKLEELSPKVTHETLGQMAALREAIDAPSRAQVADMIKDELAQWHSLKKIVLTKDDRSIILPDETRHFLFADILTAVHEGIHVALIGPAGSGKSTVMEQIASTIGFPYYLQNAVTGTHELAGYMDAHGVYHGTAFRTAFEKGGLLFLDEMDTSDPGALKWLNTALANGHAMFPDSDVPVKRHDDFRMAVAANTFGNGADRVYVGANQIDASTLDRFVFFDFGYDEKMEIALSGDASWTKRVQQLRKAAEKEKARVVISPRASIMGAKLLKAGWSRTACEDRLIWKGMDEELKARIQKAA